MKTVIEVFEGNITTLEVDAIVNAANRSLLGGGGVDGAIHRAADHKLLEECRTLGGCETGQAKITKGYDLKAKFVIHTVGPVWHGGNYQEDELLASCYKNSLKIASTYKVKSIAFPSISTGAYGFPFERAAKIAIATVKKFIEGNVELGKIIFVCFGKDAFEVYNKLLSKHDNS